MNKKILRLAIPNIISNISVPVLSAVDTSLMGHISESKLAAVGIASMLFNFLYLNFGFLRMGTTGITAQAFGKNDPKTIYETLIRATLIAILLAGTIIIFRNPLFNAGAYLMNITENNYYAEVYEYFSVRIWALPAGFLLFVIFGWFFGIQNSFVPMAVTIFSNILNIAFSVYYVKVLNTGIAGVALGTVWSQYLSLFVVVFILMFKHRSKIKNILIADKINPKNKNSFLIFNSSLFKIAEFSKFLKINSDIFIRTVLLTYVLFSLYSFSVKGGGMLPAATAVLLQFINILSYGIDGFAHASESLAGRFFGAKDRKNLMKSIKYSFAYSAGLSLACSFVFFFFSKEISSLFTNSEELQNYIQSMSLLLGIIPVIAFAGYVWDGIFIGITAVKQMRNSMIIASSGFTILYFALKNFTEPIYALWYSLAFFFFLRSFVQTVMFIRNIKTANF